MAFSPYILHEDRTCGALMQINFDLNDGVIRPWTGLTFLLMVAIEDVLAVSTYLISHSYTSD